MTLIIVESPAKALTIEKYLGSGYKVEASMGHLVDLPKSRLAIDIEHDFEPQYITVRGKGPKLKELLSIAARADEVLLASDNDREGEAIAFHIRNAILKKLPGKTIKRIVFNEITPDAIREAVRHPREVEENKVCAQKGRRVLDRLVGYNLSPILWAKVKNGLSAGRVQSVALRLICEREREVVNFIPEEYWTLDALLNKGKVPFKASLVKWQDRKFEATSKKEVETVISQIPTGTMTVTDKEIRKKQQKPKPPFTTSTLQQAAANRLGFTSRKTMQIAQQLYEGISMGSSRVGLITYMRTDSTRISDVALDDVRKYIKEHYPKALPSEPRIYAASQKAQDAHEAIRPTYVSYEPEKVKEYLNRDQLKLYTLIWERFVSCQMSNSETRLTSYTIKSGEAEFRCHSSAVSEKGFLAVCKLLKSKDDDDAQRIPDLKLEERLTFVEWKKDQHFTQGPSRYTDASIVKMLEEKGIGRPSTYAPIISVLLDRYYVVRKNKQLQPTVLGEIISDLLTEQFPETINVDFTAKMEDRLDAVEEGTLDWHRMIGDFYQPFHEKVGQVQATLESVKGFLEEPTDQICEKCGRPMVKKLGKYGFFLACSGFPECRNTQSIPLADCPREGCGGKIVARKKANGRGREFYGCTNYPQCDFISYFKPTEQKCPKCGHFLVEKSDKVHGIYRACINDKCDFLHYESEDGDGERQH